MSNLGDGNRKTETNAPSVRFGARYGGKGLIRMEMLESY
jgi:hypothetical protein